MGVSTWEYFAIGCPLPMATEKQKYRKDFKSTKKERRKKLIGIT
jgi:hypothetical protein